MLAALPVRLTTRLVVVLVVVLLLVAVLSTLDMLLDAEDVALKCREAEGGTGGCGCWLRVGASGG